MRGKIKLNEGVSQLGTVVCLEEELRATAWQSVNSYIYLLSKFNCIDRSNNLRFSHFNVCISSSQW